MCDYRWGMVWWMDLLTTYTHHSELQVITALSLISTIHRSPQHPLSFFQPAVINSHSLSVASKSGDSSASCTHIVTLWWISHNLLVVSCQLNYGTISSHTFLQSLTQLSTELVNLNVFNITPRNRQCRKHCTSVVAHLFVSAGMCLPSYCLEMGCVTCCSIVTCMHACMLWALPSNGHCLQSHCLATGLYATISLTFSVPFYEQYHSSCSNF
jgi:hypothetical protein